MSEKIKQPNSPLAGHYNRIYASSEHVFGNGQPEAVVEKGMAMLPQGASVVEFGAGQGRNALAIASHGFNVMVRDISDVGVSLIQKAARERDMQNLHAEVADAREGIEGEYDMIVSTFMLHHFNDEEARTFIDRIQKQTKLGGLNAIVVFAAGGDFHERNPGNFFPTPQGLKEIYVDWDIVVFTEESNEALTKRPDGTSMKNIALSILAQKKG